MKNSSKVFNNETAMHFYFSQMQPSMLLKLLRKLTIDVSKLTEYTTVALRVCIIKMFLEYLVTINLTYIEAVID
jgi:hypothetical protein